LRYDGSYAGCGAPRKYGDKTDCARIPDQYLKAAQTEKEIRTAIYQAEMLHAKFAQPLNVVILVKTNLKTGVGSCGFVQQ
jgi:putative transposase